LIEGLAEYLSIGPYDPETSMWMRDAWKRKFLPPIKKLEDSYKYFPYRLWPGYLGLYWRRYGDEMIGKIWRMLSRTNDYESVLQGVPGEPLKSYQKNWQKANESAILHW